LIFGFDLAFGFCHLNFQFWIQELNSKLGMFGFDNSYSQNTQVGQGVNPVKLYAKIISANLFSKAKQAFASAFAPAYASAVA